MARDNGVLILYGPTAVGKTDIALQLAERRNAEIINMDVGQFYVPLSIGTAKPPWRSYTTPHHLFDSIDKPINITVAEYRALVLETIEGVWRRGNLPILVGGSGFYLKSLFFPPQGKAQPISPDYTGLSNEAVWQLLHAVDPIRAKAIHPSDRYRVERALAIWHGSGKKPSELLPDCSIPFPFLAIFLERDRQELYTRINERVKLMMHEGWLQEVKQLEGTAWQPFLKTKKIIGYDDLFSHIEDPIHVSLEQTIETIQTKTRRYAKRQITFARMLEKQLLRCLETATPSLQKHSAIDRVNLTLFSYDLYIEQLIAQLERLQL